MSHTLVVALVRANNMTRCFVLFFEIEKIDGNVD
nr:MAG TPA: hypothetical protein [Caudoviricetes sp.]